MLIVILFHLILFFKFLISLSSFTKRTFKTYFSFIIQIIYFGFKFWNFGRCFGIGKRKWKRKGIIRQTPTICKHAFKKFRKRSLIFSFLMFLMFWNWKKIRKKKRSYIPNTYISWTDFQEFRKKDFWFFRYLIFGKTHLHSLSWKKKIGIYIPDTYIS